MRMSTLPQEFMNLSEITQTLRIRGQQRGHKEWELEQHQGI